MSSEGVALALSMDVRTNLAELRARRGLAAAQLASKIGVSRQTIYAIETGTYIPNTAVSLMLARELDATVEEIFQLEPEARAPAGIVDAFVVGDTASMVAGQPLRLCTVDRRLVAVAPEPGGLGLPPADAALVGLVRGSKRMAKAKVQVRGDKWKKSTRILLAGCDPSVSILVQSMQAQGCDLVVAYENSSRSLELLREGLVHVAGTHLADQAAGRPDVSPIGRLFGPKSVAVFSYAVWKEGFVTAPGNPKHISSVKDLTRKDVQFANRELGAGCRRLLDDLLRAQGVGSKQVNGYRRVIAGHLPAARLVSSGEVDCCISTQAVARALALDFAPLAQKPYHLVIRRKQLTHPPVQTLLDTLNRASFRREVESCTGYDMSTAGDRLM